VTSPQFFCSARIRWAESSANGGFALEYNGPEEQVAGAKD